MVGSGSAAASVTLIDRTGSSTLRATAGYRGSKEDGEWGNNLYVSVTDNPQFSTRLAATLDGNQPGRLQGNAIAATVDLSTQPPTLTFDVDSPATTFAVTLDDTTLPVPAQATSEDMADAINTQAGQRVVESASAGGILIVSRAKAIRRPCWTESYLKPMAMPGRGGIPSAGKSGRKPGSNTSSRQLAKSSTNRQAHSGDER